MTNEALTRFRANVIVADQSGCWEWLGALTYGYGVLFDSPRPNRRLCKAARLAYKHWISAIPNGFQLDHLCRNPRCVCPWHVEPVTPGDNVRRAVPFREHVKQCPHGHAYTPENSAYHPCRPTIRRCLTCVRTQNRERQRRAAQLRASGAPN